MSLVLSSQPLSGVFFHSKQLLVRKASNFQEKKSLKKMTIYVVHKFSYLVPLAGPCNTVILMLSERVNEITFERCIGAIHVVLLDGEPNAIGQVSTLVYGQLLFQ